MPTAATVGRPSWRMAVGASATACVCHARKWRVLLHDRHEGYIDWEEFERNLCVIANNTNRNGQAVQGFVSWRSGAAGRSAAMRSLWTQS